MIEISPEFNSPAKYFKKPGSVYGKKSFRKYSKPLRKKIGRTIYNRKNIGPDISWRFSRQQARRF